MFTIQAAVVATLAFATLAAAADAGTMTVYSCHTPTGRTAGTGGWRHEALFAAPGTSLPQNDCATRPSGRLYAWIGGSAYQHIGQERQSWIFETAPDTTIGDFSAAVCGRAWSAYSVAWAWHSQVAWGGGVLASATAPLYDKGTLGCGEVAPYYSPGTIPVSGLDVADASGYSPMHVSGVSSTQVTFGVWCQVTPCDDPRGVMASFAVSRFRADIRDDSPPRVANVRGPLAANASHAGPENVTFDASDVGVGVFRAVAEVRVRRAGPWTETVSAPIAPRSTCSPLRETTYLYEFDHPQPCPLSAESAALVMDSGLVPPGSHDLRVVLEDAAGNRTDVIPPRIYFVPEPAKAVPAGSSQLLASNGRGAARSVQLRITAPGKRRLPSAGPFRLAGRLLDTDSKPIAGATLSVQIRDYLPKASTSAGPWTTLGEIVTGEDGVFRARVPRGASRSLLVTYKARLEDPDPTATVQTDLVVPAQVSVRAKRTHLRNGRTVVFSGRVAGPIPQGGVLVALEVREPGRWIPVATTRRWVRTRSSGTFTLSYRFTRTFRPASYRFRVVADEDSAFEYGRGASQHLDIHVRP
jgi:hypothetical protein